MGGRVGKGCRDCAGAAPLQEEKSCTNRIHLQFCEGQLEPNEGVGTEHLHFV